MKRRGISGIAAGYLFLRPGVDKALLKQFRHVGLPVHSIDNWAWQSPADGIAGAQMMAPKDRKAGFDRLRALAADHGIEVHVCACKNPDLSIRSNCQIAGPLPTPAPGADAPLFHSMGF